MKFWCGIFGLFCFLSQPVSAQTSSDPNEGCRLVKETAAGQYTLSWWGKSGRTYFVQVSPDLETWHYLDHVVAGAGAVAAMGFETTDERFFLRLRYTDASNGGNPSAADFDADGIPSGWELDYGFDPFRDEGFEDADGDAVPNVYEYANNTNPLLTASKPTPHAVVDPATGGSSSSDNVYTTIAAAVNSVPTTTSAPLAYHVITVAPGSYPERISISNRRLLLMGTTLGANPVIAPLQYDAIQISLNSGGTVLRGLTISGANRSAIYTGRAVTKNTSGKMAFIDCVFTDHQNHSSDGAALYLGAGSTVIANCTFVNNSTPEQGESIYLNSGATALVHNSILWNRLGPVGREIQGPGIATVQGCVVDAVGVQNPILSGALLTTLSFVAINTGLVSSFSKVDIQGEARTSVPDIGADEFVDSDVDGLSDYWEMAMTGGLALGANGDEDGDALANLFESILGMKPALTDSDGDGLSDLAEALMSANTMVVGSPYAEDADSDGLTLIQEMILGTDETNPDTNGDGISDGGAWSAGIHPAHDDADADGLSVIEEIAAGTSPMIADTDGDGANDSLDVFPLDPNASSFAVGGGDTTPPVVTLHKPAGATLVP